MCLIVFAWQAHPDYPLVLAANRDEFHDRPASPMHWWSDAPGLLAGRDLEAGGSWLALGAGGRYAAVTNYREGPASHEAPRSRGELVTRYVGASDTPESYARSIEPDAYRAYNLLAGNADCLVYTSNRGDEPVRLAPAVYGLSNASLDAPWPKLVRTRETLREMLEHGVPEPDALFGLLADRRTDPAADPSAGSLDPALAEAVTAPFIVNPVYGTRCTTVVFLRRDGEVRVSERRFDRAGEPAGESTFRYLAKDAAEPPAEGL